MIKRVVMWLVLVPFALLLALFALANRQTVAIGIDPISPQTPFWGPIEVPLFVVIYGALLVGVLLGGIGDWLNQGKHRKAERQLRREVNKLQKESDNAATPQRQDDPLALLDAPKS